MRFLKFAGLAGGLALAAWAQSGTVKSDGQPIPGAVVRATQGERVLTTLTDANGAFAIDKMTPGTWTVEASMFGFDTVRKEVQIGAQTGAAPVKIDFGLPLREFRGGFGGLGSAGGRQGGNGGGVAGEPGAGGFGRGGGGRSGGGGGQNASGFPGGRGGGPNGPGQNGNATNANGGGPNALNQDPLAAAAAEAQASVQDAAANTLAGDSTAGGAISQVAATDANESFLVNGSISAGLNTQPGDFAPFAMVFGPGGPNGPGLNAAGVPAGLPPGAQVIDQGPGGGNVVFVPRGGAPGGGGGGPVLFGGGPGPGGGGFGGGRGGGFGGGRDGGRGGRGGNGAFIGNRRNAGRTQIRGSLFYTFRNSALDAAPFSLNGQADTKAAYAQNRFGFNIGGPLEIPKLFKSEKTFFFVNYTGNLLRNGQNLTGTVPTLAERAGDFSGTASTIYMPAPGSGAPAGCTSAVPTPFANNRIPGNCIGSIAQGLLAYIPRPNQPGTVNNYRFITATPNHGQALNARVMQTLSRKDQLGFGFNWQGRDAINPQLFGFTDSSTGNGINENTNWRHTFGTAMFNNLMGTFNRNTNSATPFFAGGPNVAAQLGIQGTSANPINYGPPNLNFTNFGGLTDGSPSASAVYSVGFSDQFAWRRGKHNWMFGGGYARSFNNTVTDANGRGTFTFTGLSTSLLNSSGNVAAGTGYDFADFLLGLPQSNSIRYGSSSTYFRSNSYNLFAQDDWRLLPNLTINLGLRYEYFAPWQEKYGRIANLDIAPGFSAVAVVTPDQSGPYSGQFPGGLIRPDRNNFSPRTALAWKPKAKSSVVVRLGYGWYYNPGVYNQFMSRLSAQPPFAQSTTVNTSVADPLTLATGLTVTPAGKTILNTYAVDPNYRDMYAQTWNASLQSNLPGSLVGELAYLGTKGTRLDVQEMPNQAPPGSPLTSEQRLAIGNATGFIYDTPIGNSIYHAFQARLNRRFRRGLSATLQYTFAKSIDDSSTLGGAGNAVAQNFYDISSERGLSSFDRRHNFTANYVWQSPVGSRGFLANRGWVTKALEDWTISGSATIQSGMPLTARVLGNLSDAAGTGNFGSGRASATGLPVDAGSGFFNLAAFTIPAPGSYGNAGRNTIPGPGTFSLNLSLQRTVTLGERLRLQLRADANNFTNHVNITGWGTVVNSLTYGAPTSAGGMRSLTLTARFNF
jgi:hypothetical protein